MTDETVEDGLDDPSAFVADMAARLRDEIGKAVRGQESVIETALVALIAGGHALIEGVPGTAKTLTVRAIAGALDAGFKRIQFTPDLMPSDILGTNVYDAASGQFRLRRGPIFTEFLLADEINRTPPKTQAALLEAMEERRVTVDGVAEPLPDAFTVFATQNPVEYEGTYPLPEAQLDRFLVKIVVDYPEAAAEDAMLFAWDRGFRAGDLSTANLKPVAARHDLRRARASLPAVRLEERVRGYLLEIVRETRRNKHLILGGSPRASVALLLAAKARALIHGRPYVNPDDIKAMAAPVLRHRVLLQPEAELQRITADLVLDGILQQTEVPR